MKKRRKGSETPVRFRAARADATIGSIARRIEHDYQLPNGSVVLVLPSRRRAHVDGRIANLLRRWEDAQAANR
jgi:hypothetical protein